MEQSFNLTEHVAEEAIIGLLLAGYRDAYRYATPLAPSDFENVALGRIYEALCPFHDAISSGFYEADIPISDITDALDRANLIDPAPDSFPLSVYLSFVEKAASRIAAADSKFRYGRTEALETLVARVRVASAARQDRMQGNDLLLELIPFQGESVSRTIYQLISQGGILGEYLLRFNASFRPKILAEFLERGARMGLWESPVLGEVTV